MVSLSVLHPPRLEGALFLSRSVFSEHVFLSPQVIQQQRQMFDDKESEFKDSLLHRTAGSKRFLKFSRTKFGGRILQ